MATAHLGRVLVVSLGIFHWTSGVDSHSDPGCHSNELTPDVAEWRYADDDVTVQMALNKRGTCDSLRSCKLADSDEHTVKQLVPVALEQSRDLRLLMSPQDQLDVYRVNESGFINCQVEQTSVRYRSQLSGTGAPLNATSLVTVVISRDQLRHRGSYYFIGVNSNQSAGVNGSGCVDGLRLNVTVRPADCSHEKSWTNGSTMYGVTAGAAATACSGLGRCVAQRYSDHVYRCACCRGWNGLYCDTPSNTSFINNRDVSTTSTIVRSLMTDNFNNSNEENVEKIPQSYSSHDNDDALFGMNVTCELSCRNNGSCIEETPSNTGSQRCQCAVGWTGALCESPVVAMVTDHTICSPETCVNGICALPNDDPVAADGNSVLRCYCIPGYGGDHCELSYSTCLSGPCLNGGLCIETMLRGHTCECMEGFTGDNCEFIKEVNNCQPNPCQHICLDYGQYYVCECNPGLTGVRCDEDIDDCLTNPCHNGALCIDELAGYHCQCATGYHGRHCEQTNFTSDWSMLFMTSRQVGGATRHLHSWTMAFCTLVGALLIALLVITMLYCKVHGLYRSILLCRRSEYDTQTDELFPSETTRVHQSAGTRQCVTWSVRALIQAAVETVRLDRGEGTPQTSSLSSISPKVPLVTDVKEDSNTEQTSARKLPFRAGRRRSRNDDVAETSVTIEV